MKPADIATFVVQVTALVTSNAFLCFLTSRHPTGNGGLLVPATMISLAAGIHWGKAHLPAGLAASLVVTVVLTMTATATSLAGILYRSQHEEMGGMLILIAPIAIGTAVFVGCIGGIVWRRLQ